MSKPKVLFLDIETLYMLLTGWGLFDQNFAPSQIRKDWSIIAFGAKWLGSKDVIYRDTSREKDHRNDKNLLTDLWDLLDEADIVVGHNSKQFDVKKINARLAKHGFKPYSSFKQIDTKNLAKKHFGFTSNKLEYLCDFLGVKYKKSKHEKFPGQALWDECDAGNPEAWHEMQAYNTRDVLATEEVYKKLIAWGSPINFDVYEDRMTCTCGSTQFKKYGFAFTSVGKFQRYQCLHCGAEKRSRINIANGDNVKSLVTR